VGRERVTPWWGGEPIDRRDELAGEVDDALTTRHRVMVVLVLLVSAGVVLSVRGSAELAAGYCFAPAIFLAAFGVFNEWILRRRRDELAAEGDGGRSPRASI
jgi:hypothetical protein